MLYKMLNYTIHVYIETRITAELLDQEFFIVFNRLQLLFQGIYKVLWLDQNWYVFSNSTQPGLDLKCKKFRSNNYFLKDFITFWKIQQHKVEMTQDPPCIVMKTVLSNNHLPALLTVQMYTINIYYFLVLLRAKCWSQVIITIHLHRNYELLSFIIEISVFITYT